MLEFKPVLNAKPSLGLVLRVGKEDQFLRVTHVFSRSIYVMWVGGPEGARFARRPARKTFAELQKIAEMPGSSWGQLALPPALTTFPSPDSDRGEALEVAWNLINPLLELLDQESNLNRQRFTMLIRMRAAETQSNFASLFRLILRFYYFGRTRLALLRMPPGVKPGNGSYPLPTKDQTETQPKRRGRKAILSNVYGPNDFIVSEDDIDDMVGTLKSLLRKGPTHLSHAHEHYLAGAFRSRHPALHAEYLSDKRIEPVTCRQFRYYIGASKDLSEKLTENLVAHKRNAGHLGALCTVGPAELYEIDSTVGRLYLVSSGENPVHLEKPTIYLIIDRWSRFVVSAYLSLRAPSYEEVRHALLIAFTSRERRFGALGINIDNDRWPVGRMPAVLCADRGSEYLSKSFERSVVQDLRIELTELPPYCPDGKAIVERLIREVKRRMAATKIKGVYAARPLDPQTKRAAKRAGEAAVHSLADAYRLLINIIDDHNNRPHSALKKRRVLTHAGVAPTPKTAYLWGLEHISGLRSPPFSDNDYKQMLLASDTASIGSGVVRYRGRAYLPGNEAAINIAKSSARRSKQISIRVDRTEPQTVFIVSLQGEWASFEITRGDASDLAGFTLDEEEVGVSQSSLLWAKSEHTSRVNRIANKSATAKVTVPNKGPAIKLGKLEQNVARATETKAMKSALTGGKKKNTQVVRDPKSNTWAQIEEEERLRTLDLVRQHRRKR